MQIVKLEPSKHVAERWLCWLEDGSCIRVTESEVVSFALYTGMVISDDLYDQLTDAAARSGVRSKALDYISARPMSRKELVDKLTARRPKGKDGRERPPLATPEQAAEAADWLEDLGYLNDAEYAKTVARHYSAKGYGDRKLKDEFFRRGISRQYWEAALQEAQEPEEGIDAFLQKRFRGQIPDQRELKRDSDALARRGFSWSEISDALRRYGMEVWD